MVHLQIFTFYNRKELKRNMKETDKILAIIASTYCIALLLFLAIFGYTPTNDGDGYIEFAQVCIKANRLTHAYLLSWDSHLSGTSVLSILRLYRSYVLTPYILY